jgi:Leucine-rich repeat (LRR) protein
VIKGAITLAEDRTVERTFNSNGGDLLSTYQGVKSFRITYTTIRFFPRNIENFFENLVMIDLWKVNLEEISSRDLKPFANLIRLSLSGNKITILEENLFEHNKNLEVIELADNRISKIYSVFNELQNLKSLDFSNNPCHSAKVEYDQSLTLITVKEINEKCGDKEVNPCESIELEVEKLKKENAELKKQNAKLKRENSKCKKVG